MLLQAAQESKDANISTIRSIVMKTLSEPDIFCGYDQIKAVRVASATGEKPGTLQVVTDDETEEIGQGLSPAALAYLRTVVIFMAAQGD